MKNIFKRNPVKFILTVVGILIVLLVFYSITVLGFQKEDTISTRFDKSAVNLVYKNFVIYNTSEKLYTDFLNLNIGVLDIEVTGYAYFSIKNNFKIAQDGSKITISLNGFEYDGFDEEDLKLSQSALWNKTHFDTDRLDATKKIIREKTDEYIEEVYMARMQQSIKEQIRLKLFDRLKEKYKDMEFEIYWNT